MKGAAELGAAEGMVEESRPVGGRGGGCGRRARSRGRRGGRGGCGRHSFERLVAAANCGGGGTRTRTAGGRGGTRPCGGRRRRSSPGCPVAAVGHGMEGNILSEMINVTRGFYKLPLEEKQKYSNLVNGKDFRIEGYGNDMVVSEKQVLDWCDRFYLIVEPESRIAHSLWPTQPPPFRDVLREYTVRCREITSLVLNKLAKLLGLSEGYLVDMFDEKAMTYARFNYYPRCPRPDQVFGLKPHSDASMITIVAIDDTVSGLQLLRQGVWYDVPIVPNALLINVGDGIEIMSNGLFKSPVHRVVTNAERERVSLAMFYTLDPEKELEPVPELVDDEKRPRQYGKVKTKDYVTGLFETLARGTRVIDTVKISDNLNEIVS